MKKIIIAALAALTLISCTACASVRYDTDTVTVVDGADLVWQFTGCEDYCIGNLVEMLMQKTGKPDYILDDVIFSTCYAGFCAEYFQN